MITDPAVALDMGRAGFLLGLPIRPWLMQEIQNKINGQQCWLDTFWQANQLPATATLAQTALVTALTGGGHQPAPVPGQGQQGPDIAQELTLMIMELVVLLGYGIPHGAQERHRILHYVKLALGLKVSSRPLACPSLAPSLSERLALFSSRIIVGVKILSRSFSLSCVQFIYWPAVNPSPITTIRQLNFDYQGQIGRLVAPNQVIHTKLIQFHDINQAGLFRYNQLLSYRGYAANADGLHLELFKRLARLPFCPRHGLPNPLP
jgi:hypothetical protein